MGSFQTVRYVSPFSPLVVQLTFLSWGLDTGYTSMQLVFVAFMTIIVSFFIFVLSEHLNHYLMKKWET
jgi:hypothetical protein